MDLALQIALTIAAAAGIWAWIIADWLPRQWVLSNDRSPTISDETHRWVRRLEAGIACGLSAGVVGLLQVYFDLIDLL